MPHVRCCLTILFGAATVYVWCSIMMIFELLHLICLGYNKALITNISKASTVVHQCYIIHYVAQIYRRSKQDICW